LPRGPRSATSEDPRITAALQKELGYGNGERSPARSAQCRTAPREAVRLTYLLRDGATLTQPVEVPANGRSTINVETVDARLANADVSTIITSDIGIIVERSMYWPELSQGWQEAHNSVGVTAPALRWAVADGRLDAPARIRPSCCWRIRIRTRRRCTSVT
jgi:hypothetical protein